MAATLTKGKDEQSRLPYWQIVDKGMSLRLVQRLPDQTRAFFQARGFSSKHADRIAMSCAFQTVFSNTSKHPKASPLSFNLREWIVIHQSNQSGLKTREDWQIDWNKLKVKNSAALAFEWSLLPTRIQYEPADYNWGITFYDLKPGSKFDLDVRWKQFGVSNHYIINNVQCAPDIHPDPEKFLEQAND